MSCRPSSIIDLTSEIVLTPGDMIKKFKLNDTFSNLKSAFNHSNNRLIIILYGSGKNVLC